MPWLTKLYLCNWCEEETDALIDPVFESEKGTLCAKCEKGRLAEREMYKEKRDEARIQREIERVQKELAEEK